MPGTEVGIGTAAGRKRDAIPVFMSLHAGDSEQVRKYTHSSPQSDEFSK